MGQDIVLQPYLRNKIYHINWNILFQFHTFLLFSSQFPFLSLKKYLFYVWNLIINLTPYLFSFSLSVNILYLLL